MGTIFNNVKGSEADFEQELNNYKKLIKNVGFTPDRILYVHKKKKL